MMIEQRNIKVEQFAYMGAQAWRKSQGVYFKHEGSEYICTSKKLIQAINNCHDYAVPLFKNDGRRVVVTLNLSNISNEYIRRYDSQRGCKFQSFEGRMLVVPTCTIHTIA